MKNFFRILPCLAVILCLPHDSPAQVYPLQKANVVGCGGGDSFNGNVYLDGTVGETCIGMTTSASHRNPVGYWYMVDEIHIGPTSSVVITSFRVAFDLTGITLAWVIGAADELAGFNIYRSTQENEGFARINEELIPTDKENEYLDSDVQPGREYWYRLGAVDRDGEFLSTVVNVRVPIGDLALFQNHPNPFNPSTTISFYLPKVTRAVLTIYDVQGKQLITLLNETTNFGLHEIVWNGKDDRGNPVSSGVYFYRLQVGKRVFTKKLTLLK